MKLATHNYFCATFYDPACIINVLLRDGFTVVVTLKFNCSRITNNILFRPRLHWPSSGMIQI